MQNMWVLYKHIVLTISHRGSIKDTTLLWHDCSTSIFLKPTIYIFFTALKRGYSTSKVWFEAQCKTVFHVNSLIFPDTYSVLFCPNQSGKKWLILLSSLPIFSCSGSQWGLKAKPSKHWAKYWTEGRETPWTAVLELGQYSPTGNRVITCLPVYCNISLCNSRHKQD